MCRSGRCIDVALCRTNAQFAARTEVPMAVRKINPWLKLALELGPVLLFFVGYMRIKDQLSLIHI